MSGSASLPGAVSAPMEEKIRGVRPATLEEFANRVAGLPLIADPGTKWSYSIGLDVMGRVIEVASGMPFDRFVEQRIFDAAQDEVELLDGAGERGGAACHQLCLCRRQSRADRSRRDLGMAARRRAFPMAAPAW